MENRHITQSVWYTGVDDNTTTLFESLWPLPMGVSYNSYLVRGEKTALIDTVDISRLPNLLKLLEELHAEAPDYIVVNHMEPDHSGSLPELLLRYPQAKVVGNRLTAAMLGGYYGVPAERVLEVKDGDTLDLGAGRILAFRTIPMVHWPETMVTYLASEGVLFSGDAFGTFGALGGKIVDASGNIDAYLREMHRYYACIVAKYGQQVQAAKVKLSGLDIKYICSTHGPVWNQRIGWVLDIYDRLSRNLPVSGVTVVYGSMYGHTETLARRVAMRLSEAGLNVALHDASRTDLSYLLRDIWTYEGLVIASPTYNGDVFPPLATLLHALELRGLKNRKCACLGDYTWAPAACRKIEESFDRMGLETVYPGLQVKMNPRDTDFQAIDSLADTMAASLGK